MIFKMLILRTKRHIVCNDKVSIKVSFKMDVHINHPVCKYVKVFLFSLLVDVEFIVTLHILIFV